MTYQRYKQNTTVQALPPGTKAQGGMIQGWQGVYPDAEQRRLLPEVQHPAAPARAVVGEVLPPEQAYMQPPAQPLSRVELHTTYADRSRGFLLSTLPLASVAGLVASVSYTHLTLPTIYSV